MEERSKLQEELQPIAGVFLQGMIINKLPKISFQDILGSVVNFFTVFGFILFGPAIKKEPSGTTAKNFQFYYDVKMMLSAMQVSHYDNCISHVWEEGHV